MSRPPSLLRRALDIGLPRGPVRSSLPGDLEELWAERVESRGRFGATTWYAGQVAGALLRYAPARLGLVSGPDGAGSLESLSQDLKYAARTLLRTPRFTLVAVLTLGLGIGATSAIFSVVDAVLLRSLPFAEPERLVHVRTAYPNGKSYLLSAPDFASLREGTELFRNATAFASSRMTMVGRGEPEELQAVQVAEAFFDVMGVSPLVGRSFHPDEHRNGSGRVVMLDHAMWQREWGSDASVVGRTVTLNGEPHTIVGVLPPGVAYPAGSDIYVPLQEDERFDPATARGRRSEWLNMIARIEPGVERTQVAAELRRVGQRLQQEFPGTNERLTFTAVGLQDVVLGGVRTPLLVLMGAVGLVLLIACANVANLLLARSTARESEFAIRTALGAGRGRLLRQMITESVVLSASGGVVGLLLAVWGTRLLVALDPSDIPRLEHVGVNATIMMFTAAVALLTGVVFGVVPARQGLRREIGGTLRSGGRGGSSTARSNRFRGGLVVIEMSLAVILLIGAGLLGRSFLELTTVDPGFRPEGATAFRVSLPSTAYPDAAQRREFFSSLRNRIRTLNGVTAVGGVSALPLTGGADVLSFAIEGKERTGDQTWEIRAVSVTPGYFQAMDVPLRQGRLLTERDRVEAPSVLVINRAAAERWFPGEDPIGQRLMIGEPWEIVGVVGDVKQSGLSRAAEPEIYVPHEQWSVGTMQIVVRTAGEPQGLAGEVRSQVHALDPNLPVERFAPLEEVVAQAVARPRFFSTLLGLFAISALALACIGLFGVISYAVAQRRREIGIRVALGARPTDVLGGVIGRAMILAAAGLTVGIFGAVALTRLLRSQLYGVSHLDPVTYVAVAVLLTGVAFLASYLPARSAMRVNPITALRSE